MLRPTLKQLHYFQALRREAHFGRAADACGITQSTLSAAIHELEEVLGVALIERQGRSFIVTPLGHEVADEAGPILAAVDHLTAKVASGADPLAGQLHVGIIPTVAPFLLPDIIPALRRHYPDLKVRLTEDKSAPLCDRLARGDLDLLMLALPFACGDVVVEPFLRDRFVAAFPPGEGELPPTIGPQDLDGATLLLLEEGHCLRDHALAVCKMRGVDPSRSILATSLLTLVQMVDSGLGATLLPQLALDGGLLRGTGVRTRPLVDPTAERLVGLVWRRHDPRGEHFLQLAATLKTLTG